MAHWKDIRIVLTIWMDKYDDEDEEDNNEDDKDEDEIVGSPIPLTSNGSSKSASRPVENACWSDCTTRAAKVDGSPVSSSSC